MRLNEITPQQRSKDTKPKINGNRLRIAAPRLYKASKAALDLLLGYDHIPKEAVIVKLREAIDVVEDPLRLSTITIVITHKTAEMIDKFVARANDGSEIDKKLISMLRKGRRNTKRRVYLRLDIDIPVLSRLRDILDTSYPVGASSRAFSRIADQIEKEALSKSPLQLLAAAGE